MAALGCLPPVACGPDLGEACGHGEWQRGALEIHHFDLGQADSTLVVTPDGRSLLIDVGEGGADTGRGAVRVGERVRAILGCRRIDLALITHFHLDHVGAPGRGGLWHLLAEQRFAVGAIGHRDLHRFVGEAGRPLLDWRTWLRGPDGSAARAQVMSPGQHLDMGPLVQARLVAGDGAGALRPGDWSSLPAAPSENDYSLGLVLRFGRLDYFVGGDLSGGHVVGRGGGFSYHDLESAVAPAVGDIDVLRVNHHGSAHSSNDTFLGHLDPEVSIVSVGQGNGHGHPHPQTLERLLGTGAVYLTGRGDPRTPLGAARVLGDVLLRSSDGQGYSVGPDRFAAQDPVRVDADSDGYFREVDPDDSDPARVPAPFGGCDPIFQVCACPAACPP